MLIVLGNTAPIEGEPGLYHSHAIDGEVEHFHSYGETHAAGRKRTGADDVVMVRGLHIGMSNTTTLDVPDDEGLTPEALAADMAHLWPHHSLEAPGFIQCEDAQVREALMAVFGLSDPGGITALYTNAGRDWVSQQVLGSAVAAATNQMKYIALTANSSAAVATDTTLTGEITTGGGGLIRGAGTVAHTTGASTTTVTKTHTANGSDSLPVTIAKEGLFNDPAAGAMGFETLLGTTATLSASGDALTTTWTINH